MQLEECGVDLGGYFIIKGSEKVLVGQERQLQNQISVTKTNLKTEPWMCEIYSKRVDMYNRVEHIKLVLKKNKQEDQYIVCRHRLLKKELPISMLMFALGIGSDLEILATVCDIGTWQELYLPETERMLQVLRYSLEQTLVKNRKNSLAFIGKVVGYNKEPQNQ